MQPTRGNPDSRAQIQSQPLKERPRSSLDFNLFTEIAKRSPKVIRMQPDPALSWALLDPGESSVQVYYKCDEGISAEVSGGLVSSEGWVAITAQRTFSSS